MGWQYFPLVQIYFFISGTITIEVAKGFYAFFQSPIRNLSMLRPNLGIEFSFIFSSNIYHL